MTRFVVLISLLIAIQAQHLPADYQIPDRCLEMYDGCNFCTVDQQTRQLTACTEMACFQQEAPRCVRYARRTDCANIMCIAVYEPVCASNGHTYANRCEFERVECNSQPGLLRVVHEGECTEPNAREPEEREDCNKVCPAVWDPVCASIAGAVSTFGNKCEMAVRACEERTDSLFMHAGECTDEDFGARVPAFDIPSGCKVFNDGCNDCQVLATGNLGSCTKMLCDEASIQAPHCVSFVSGDGN